MLKVHFDASKEEKEKNEAKGLNEKLLKTRTILIYGGITQKVAEDVSRTFVP